MKSRITLLPLLLFVLLFSACTMKVPEMSDPNKGLVAIPVEVENSTQYMEIACDYLLTTGDDETEIMVRSQVGQRLVYSDQLEPGMYHFTEATELLDHQNYHSSSYKRTIPFGTASRLVSVEPGKITVPYFKIIIEQYNSEHDLEVFHTGIRLEGIGDSARNEFIEKYLILNEESEWVVR